MIMPCDDAATATPPLLRQCDESFSVEKYGPPPVSKRTPNGLENEENLKSRTSKGAMRVGFNKVRKSCVALMVIGFLIFIRYLKKLL